MGERESRGRQRRLGEAGADMTLSELGEGKGTRCNSHEAKVTKMATLDRKAASSPELECLG